MLKISKYCLRNLIFKKVQRALENILVGTFLPLGSGLATPGLDRDQAYLKFKFELANNIPMRIGNRTVPSMELSL